jgi:predicted porin
MKKKLLVLAVGATITAGPMMIAQADVKIGGAAQVEIAREDHNGPKTTTVEDNARGRFWIAASEDLGGGMKGLAHFEFRVDTTGVCALEEGGAACSAKAANTREKWVGLQGGFGTLKLGSVKSPYKYAGGVKWDAFVTTNLEARGNGGMSPGTFGQNQFFDNSVNYTSPSFGGVTFGVTYSFDDVLTDAGTSQTVTAQDGDYAAAVEWKTKFGGNALHLILARAEDQVNTSPAPADNFNATKIGAKFDFMKNFSIIGQYENLKNDTSAANTVDEDYLFLGFQAKFGNVTGVVQLAKNDENGTGTGADTERTYVVLGAWYNFSKSFSAFGGYRKTTVEDILAPIGPDQDTKIYTVGLRKGF